MGPNSGCWLLDHHDSTRHGYGRIGRGRKNGEPLEKRAYTVACELRTLGPYPTKPNAALPVLSSLLGMASRRGARSTTRKESIPQRAASTSGEQTNTCQKTVCDWRSLHYRVGDLIVL